ncbi:hypothetical protein IVB03_27785 [Bradyrhizobium sp. 168]|uniref:hypothetical protein n=1 Tax=Bradyrhizobium sp. 168 TaxID=2782639 RepID=UPI001FFAEE59|nr:hypothetical protein [Bradyrhizobium sp. 168]MCK1583261.1 hypothetical protein [Bradyrhizobium sp. 168]
MSQQHLNTGLSREQIRAAVQADFVELYAALNSAYGSNLVPRLLNSGLSDSQVLDFTRANFADLYAAVKAQGLTGAPRYLNAGLSSDQLRAATQANFTDLYTLLGTVRNTRQYLQSSLSSAGLLTAFDSLYLLGGADATLSLTDIAKPSRVATVSGSVPFVANRGYTPDGVSGFIDTLFNPAVDGVNFTQNSNCHLDYILTAVATPVGGWDFGQTNYTIGPFGSVKTQDFSRNSSTASLSKSLVAQAGLYASNRFGSTGYDTTVEGGVLFSGAKTSSGSNIFISGSQEAQGWCTDASFYYVATTSALYKRAVADWSISASNLTPFASVPGSSNHTGDIDIYNGNLYVPSCSWSGSCGGSNTNSRINLFSATDLSFVSSTAISEVLAGLAIDSVRGLIYGVDYCDPTVCHVYDLVTRIKLRTITLPSIPFQNFQGVAYNSDTLFVSCTNSTSNIYVLAFDLSGSFLYGFNPTDAGAVGSIEGLSFSGSSCGIMLDNHTSTAQVNFYTLPTLGTNNSFTQASSVVNSETFTIGKRNGTAVFSANQHFITGMARGFTPAELRTVQQIFKRTAQMAGAV